MRVFMVACFAATSISPGHAHRLSAGWCARNIAVARSLLFEQLYKTLVSIVSKNVLVGVIPVVVRGSIFFEIIFFVELTPGTGLNQTERGMAGICFHSRRDTPTSTISGHPD